MCMIETIWFSELRFVFFQIQNIIWTKIILRKKYIIKFVIREKVT